MTVFLANDNAKNTVLNVNITLYNLKALLRKHITSTRIPLFCKAF